MEGIRNRAKIAAIRSKLVDFEVPPNYEIGGYYDYGAIVSLTLKPRQVASPFSIVLQLASLPGTDSASRERAIAHLIKGDRSVCKRLIELASHSVQAKSQTIWVRSMRCLNSGSSYDTGLAAVRGKTRIVMLEAAGPLGSFDRSAVDRLLRSVR